VVVVEAVDRLGAGEAEEAGLQAVVEAEEAELQVVVEAVEEEGVHLQIISKFTSDQFVQACLSPVHETWTLQWRQFQHSCRIAITKLELYYYLG
jgi:hypothetical protein